jgi:molybdopterin molybdotransferase
MISIREAQQFINGYSRNFGWEEVDIDNAFNRTLAEDIYADRDYPPFNRSAMDGYALKSEDLNDKMINEFEVIENLFAGNISNQKIQNGQCIKIMTGAPVPSTADAVIRVEDTTNNSQKTIFKLTAIKPWQNISKRGEDVLQNEILVVKNQIINATIIGVLAVTGRSKIKVCKLPSVAIVSTGNEVININSPVKPYQIRDSNSHVLKAFLRQYHIDDIETSLLPDEKEELKRGIGKLLHKDILILSGGVSKGDVDYIPEVLTSLGVKEIFHRVQIKPGSPLWFGIAETGAAVFALPGNPFSVQVAFKVFIEPYLRECFGLKQKTGLFVALLYPKNKNTKLDEFFPCRLISKNNTNCLLPITFNGSGDITATCHSDGIARHPSGEQILNAKTLVQFLPWI